MNAGGASGRRRVWIAWLCVAACVVVILGLGSAEFGASQTSRYLYPFLRWLFPDLEASTYLRLLFLLRKGAHVTEYSILGVLAFRAVFLTVRSALARVALLAFCLAATVASVDEIHQTFLPERTGAARDVVLDGSAALAAISLALWMKRRAQASAAAG